MCIHYSDLMHLRFITSNQNKYEEAREICAYEGITLEWVNRKYDEPRGETCAEVVANSIKLLSREYNFPFIIEDSGLFINSLKGFPGVYSAYVYKTLGLEGILRLMTNIEDRSAKFVSVIGYFDGDVHELFEGSVEGDISSKIRGSSGFGYDPLFIPKGYKFTFAENISLKKRLSHRRKALDRLISYVAKGDM